MKYDFTTVMDRRGRDALAVDAPGRPGAMGEEPMIGGPKEGFSLIPMWVADMNFATAPTIQEAMIARIGHPAFGYFEACQAYYDAIISWQKTRNHVEGLTKEAIGYENGVLGCVASAINAFCSRGDHVLLHSPTYIGFPDNHQYPAYRPLQPPVFSNLLMTSQNGSISLLPCPHSSKNIQQQATFF